MAKLGSQLSATRGTLYEYHLSDSIAINKACITSSREYRFSMDFIIGREQEKLFILSSKRLWEQTKTRYQCVESKEASQNLSQHI